MDVIQASQAPDSSEVFAQLDAYPWDSDTEFQGGLSAILGSATSPTQIQALTLRARCFYFQRKNPNIPIDFDAYKVHVLSDNPSACLPASQSTNLTEQPSTSDSANNLAPTSTPSTTTTTNPQYPSTFASVVSLIQSGLPIPGIKEIPPTVLPDLATEPTASKRRKPWEKAEDEPEALGEKVGREVGEGTFGDRRDEIITQVYPDA